MDQDEYGTVTNSADTFKSIANALKLGNDLILAWTDNAGTQLDVLLAYKPLQVGSLQRGMNTRTDLFVAISGCGMFGFEINDLEKHPGYVGSKLGLGGENDTTVKLAELINAVIEELNSNGQPAN